MMVIIDLLLFKILPVTKALPVYGFLYCFLFYNRGTKNHLVFSTCYRQNICKGNIVSAHIFQY